MQIPQHPASKGSASTGQTPTGTAGPSKLRLSTILVEIRRGAQPQPLKPTTDSDTPAPSNNRRRRRRKPPKPRKPRIRSDVDLGEILDATAQAGFGFLAAFLALAAVPLPGVGFPFGMGVAFLGLQLLVGVHRPWLPQRMRRHNVTMNTLDWLSDKLTRYLGWLEHLVKPRWTALSDPPLLSLVGLGLTMQGVGLALPLPIPGSNWLFIIPILIYAIGLLEDDGLLVFAGHFITIAMTVAGLVFSQWIIAELGQIIEKARAWFA